jgi:hypothetical protein
MKALAEAGADVLTYYETTGWRGVMEAEVDSSMPSRFPSTPGMVFPLYYPFYDLGEMAGASIYETVSSSPRTVDALTVEKGGTTRTLLFNLTPSDRDAMLELPRREGGGSMSTRLWKRRRTGRPSGIGTSQRRSRTMGDWP